MLWRRYKKKCDMNDIECRVIMTLEGERTLADIVHFLHSQQVHAPTNRCVSLYCMFTCITVYHCVLYHYTPPITVYHCTTCDCSHVTLQQTCSPPAHMILGPLLLFV